MSIFTESRLNEVFLKIAKFPSDSKHAFIHAPFDRVTVLGQTFMEPRSSTLASGGAGLAATHYWISNDDFDSQELKADGRGLWYTELNPIVIEGHELGSYQDKPEDWLGCFSMDLI